MAAVVIFIFLKTTHAIKYYIAAKRIKCCVTAQVLVGFKHIMAMYEKSISAKIKVKK